MIRKKFRNIYRFHAVWNMVFGPHELVWAGGGAGLLDFWAKVEIGTPEACFVVLFLFFSIKYIG